VPWEIAIKANKRKIAPHALVSDFLSVMRRQDFVPI
jgi:PIN domain nuclease of toxin-antitoxin system